MTPFTAHAAHSGADPLAVILIGLAVAACYVLSLYVKPIRTCPRCCGTGARLTRAGRPAGGTCRRCRGVGRIRRIGATAVHRFWWSAVGDHLREGRRAGHQARQRTGYHPGPQPPDRRTRP